MALDDAVPSPSPARRRRLLLVVGLALTGFSMRTAVTSVGAVLDELEAGLHTTSAASGVITTLPVICFAVIGSFAPALARRFGTHHVLVASLVLTTVGLISRAVAGSVWLFALLSVLALSGGAVSNVLMPALVKNDFADRIGPATALYTTALAFGTTAAVGLTVPVADVAGGWRWGLAAWALMSAVATAPWLLSLRGDPHTGRPGRGVSLLAPARSPIAWALMLFFGAQSFQAYIGFGWFPTYLRDHGISAGRAGLLVAFYAALSIPTSMVVPWVAGRGQRAPILVMFGCGVVAYVGLLAAPVGGAWLWMLLAGIAGGAFPLALTMIGLRTAALPTTAAVSAFAQGLGYLLAGTGPLLTGVLHGATGGWGWPFAMLLVALSVSSAAGWYAAQDRTVDAELGWTSGAPAGAHRRRHDRTLTEH